MKVLMGHFTIIQSQWIVRMIHAKNYLNFF